MNEKVKYLITGFVVGAITVWFFTLITLSYNNKSPEFQMGRGMMGNYMESESIDRHFIEQMIPHHEDAIDMSEIALERGTRTEVRELAQNIIISQSEEIDQMKNWHEDWFRETYQPVGFSSVSRMGMGSGHMGAMHGGLGIEDLEKSEDFDREFVEQMIPHHQMAIMMVSMLLVNSERKEMQELGENIIEAQSSEIEMMQNWLEEWE